MSEPTTVREATFDPKVKSYYMLGLLFISVISIIGIPLLVITVPLGLLFVGRWVDRLRCVLTDRTLEIEKGILTRTESTIPLEKITDLQMVQGPIMRMLGLRAFKVETAGQTNPAGAMMMLVGIVDAPEFRRAVLAQRDRLAASAEDAAPGAAPASDARADADGVLVEIRDALLRIEGKLDRS